MARKGRRRSFEPETEIFGNRFKPKTPALKLPSPSEVAFNTLQDYETTQAANGTFIKVPTPFGTALVKDTRVTVELKPVLSQSGLRIPEWVYHEVLHFFRAVYTQKKSEAVVLFYRNRQTEEWLVSVPHQVVGGAHVGYDLGAATPVNLVTGEPVEVDPSTGWVLSGTAHSHCMMDAFWSSVDDANELPINGFHITFGKVMDSTPQLKCSVVVREQRFEIPLHQCFEMAPATQKPLPASVLARITTYVAPVVQPKQQDGLGLAGRLTAEPDLLHDYTSLWEDLQEAQAEGASLKEIEELEWALYDAEQGLIGHDDMPPSSFGKVR